MSEDVTKKMSLVIALFKMGGNRLSKSEREIWSGVVEVVETKKLKAGLQMLAEIGNYSPTPSEVLKISRKVSVQSMRNATAFAAQKHNVKMSDILSRSRKAHIARARHEAFYLSRRDGFSYPKIGRFFGRDHTTVMHGIKRHLESGHADE